MGNKDNVPKDKTYTIAEYFPCFGQFSDNVKYFVPITRQQRSMTKDKFKRQLKVEMLTKEWNSLLESCLKENGFTTPIIFTCINIIDPDKKWIVSVPEDHEDLSSCDHVVEKVTDRVSKITSFSNVMDYEISYGIVNSRMYHCPFEDSIRLLIQILLDMVLAENALTTRVTLIFLMDVRHCKQVGCWWLLQGKQKNTTTIGKASIEPRISLQSRS